MVSKRVIELALAVAFLPLAVPLGVLVAVIIWLDSPGAVFFVQTRPGRYGRPFRMVKFRTMIQLPQQPFRLTQKDDQRLTRAGKMLRKLHLDEIPQLWHVLTGEMSLIGPRPVPMELYETFRREIPGYDARHEVAPGITGLAQVRLGYVNTLEGEREKWSLDVWYIEHLSGKLDWLILKATFAKILGLPFRFDFMPEIKSSPGTCENGANAILPKSS